MSEGGMRMQPWAVAMFAAIALVVVWRLWPANEKPAASSAASESTAESAKPTAAPTDPTSAPTTLATVPATNAANAANANATTTANAPAANATAPTSTSTATADDATSAAALADPNLRDPATLRARQEQSIAFLEKRIATLDEAIKAAQVKGDQAEALRLVEQSEAAKKRLAMMRAGVP